VEHISFADDDDVGMDAPPLEIADIVLRSRLTAQSAGIQLITTARDFNLYASFTREQAVKVRAQRDAVLSEFDAELQRATATGASDFISAKEKELLYLVAKCSNQQRDAVDYVDECTKRGIQILAVSGEGGSGKSFWLSVVVLLLRLRFGGRAAVTTAWTNRAACLVGGTSVSHLFHMVEDSKKDKDKESRRLALKRDLEKVVAIFLDEKSLLSSEKFAELGSWRASRGRTTCRSAASPSSYLATSISCRPSLATRFTRRLTRWRPRRSPATLPCAVASCWRLHFKTFFGVLPHFFFAAADRSLHCPAYRV